MSLTATVVEGPKVLTNIMGTNDITLPAGRFAVVEAPNGIALAQTPGIEVPEKPQLLIGGFFPTADKAGRLAYRLNLEEYWTGKHAA